MNETDFRKEKAPTLVIEWRGEPVKIWLLEPHQISTDRVITAQYWGLQFKEIGTLGLTFIEAMRNVTQKVMDMQYTKDNFQTSKELIYNLYQIFEDMNYTRERMYNYIKMGSLFCVLENEELDHPDPTYTDMITDKKMNIAAEVADAYSFFLSVGLECMKNFVNISQESSLRILAKNQKLVKELTEPKMRAMRTLGISISRNF